MTTLTKTILINAAILTACLIQYLRGISPLVLLISGLTFLLFANILIVIKARADFHRRNPNYAGRFSLHDPVAPKATFANYRELQYQVPPKPEEEHPR